MKTSIIKTSVTLLLFIAPLFCCTACLKSSVFNNESDFVNTDTIITIKSLRRMHFMGMTETIHNEWAIQAVVVANDASNNIYKTLYVQDSTGGIALSLDGNSLYQNYPIGTMLKIRLDGLTLTDYRRMIQIVGSIDTTEGSNTTAGIATPLFSKYIQVMEEGLELKPLEVSYRNLGDSLQGRLIKVSSVEFASADTSGTYADKKNKIGLSRALKFCTGGTIYLRTSGYADFAGVKLPKGNGSVIGVYSVYNSEKQLILRDTSDILLNGKRCTGAAWLQSGIQ